jgi:membrane protein involved in colicin uptake
VEKPAKTVADASAAEAAAVKAADKKAQADKAAKEVADSNKAQLADITKRRAAAEAEALAIRDMMSTPARVLKAPSEIAAEVQPRDPRTGLLSGLCAHDGVAGSGGSADGKGMPQREG